MRGGLARAVGPDEAVELAPRRPRSERPSSAVTAPKRRTSAARLTAGPPGAAAAVGGGHGYLPPRSPASVTWTGIPARSLPSRFTTATSTG